MLFQLQKHNLLLFNVLVPGILIGRELLLQSKVVKVEVSLVCLGRLSTEVVTRMSNTLTLSNGNETQDGSEPGRFFLGKSSKSSAPVRVHWESREVQTEAERSLKC